MNGIEVAFWKTSTGEGEDAQEHCTLRIKKTYYDREKSTKTQAVYTEAKSFFPGEVPILAALLQDAFTAMGRRE